MLKDRRVPERHLWSGFCYNVLWIVVKRPLRVYSLLRWNLQAMTTDLLLILRNSPGVKTNHVFKSQHNLLFIGFNKSLWIFKTKLLLHKTNKQISSPPGSPPHSPVPPQSKVTANKYWNVTAHIYSYMNIGLMAWLNISEYWFNIMNDDHACHNHLDKLAFPRHFEGRIVVDVLLYSNLAV